MRGFWRMAGLTALRWVAAAALLAGCLGEDPASFRGVNQLITGEWLFISELQGDVHTPDLHTITIRSDGTLEAPSGLPGVSLSGYKAQFWQRGNVLGMRGTGTTLDGGIQVAFVQAEVTVDPLELRLTEIDGAYVADLMGLPDVNAFTQDQVRDAVRLLFGASLPEAALGLRERFEK